MRLGCGQAVVVIRGWRGFVVVGLLVAFVVLISVSFFGGSMAAPPEVGPRTALLATEATLFPVPVGAESAMPDELRDDPPSVVRSWRMPGQTLDGACTEFREAYRLWLGDRVTGEVGGEYAVGQSCRLTGAIGADETTLLVAVYGEDPPVATLTMTGASDVQPVR